MNPLPTHRVEEPRTLEVLGDRPLQPGQGEADAPGAEVLGQLEEHLGRRRVHVADRFQVDDDPARRGSAAADAADTSSRRTSALAKNSGASKR
jgi:hypothetical protein